MLIGPSIIFLRGPFLFESWPSAHDLGMKINGRLKIWYDKELDRIIQRNWHRLVAGLGIYGLHDILLSS